MKCLYAFVKTLNKVLGRVFMERVEGASIRREVLRELGRIERTLFILDWLQSVELRRRVHAGLNKGEARNALARAVFFNRLGESATAVLSSSATGLVASTW